MLADAIRDIEDRLRRAADGERRRRAAGRAPLRQAEAYAHRLEELLFRGEYRVPDELGEEIRLFVLQEHPQSAPSVRDRVWTRPGALLDLLFDVQECIQRQLPTPAAVSITDFETA